MDWPFLLRSRYGDQDHKQGRGILDMHASSRLRTVSGLVLAPVAALVLIGCESTQTRSCTWTAADGKQQSVVAVESHSTKADVASIEALAGVARSVLAGTAAPGQPTMRAGAQPAPSLPSLCAGMFK